MDFVTWWFEKHYIASTLLTPMLTFAWCIYKGLVIRGVFAFLLAFAIGTSSHR